MLFFLVVISVDLKTKKSARGARRRKRWGKRERKSGSTRVALRGGAISHSRARRAQPRACGCLSGSVPSSIVSRQRRTPARTTPPAGGQITFTGTANVRPEGPRRALRHRWGGAFASPIDRPARRILPTRRNRDVVRSTRCLGSCRDARLVVLARANRNPNPRTADSIGRMILGLTFPPPALRVPSGWLLDELFRRHQGV
jgi:hypothetical protein